MAGGTVVPDKDCSPKAFNLATVLILCLNALIAVMIGLGYSGVMDKISHGDNIILAQMKMFCEQMAKLEGRVTILEKDVSRIDTHQKARLERESDARRYR